MLTARSSGELNRIGRLASFFNTNVTTQSPHADVSRSAQSSQEITVEHGCSVRLGTVDEAAVEIGWRWRRSDIPTS